MKYLILSISILVSQQTLATVSCAKIFSSDFPFQNTNIEILLSDPKVNTTFRALRSHFEKIEQAIGELEKISIMSRQIHLKSVGPSRVNASDPVSFRETIFYRDYLRYGLSQIELSGIQLRNMAPAFQVLLRMRQALVNQSLKTEGIDLLIQHYWEAVYRRAHLFSTPHSLAKNDPVDLVLLFRVSEAQMINFFYEVEIANAFTNVFANAERLYKDRPSYGTMINRILSQPELRGEREILARKIYNSRIYPDGT